MKPSVLQPTVLPSTKLAANHRCTHPIPITSPNSLLIHYMSFSQRAEFCTCTSFPSKTHNHSITTFHHITHFPLPTESPWHNTLMSTTQCTSTLGIILMSTIQCPLCSPEKPVKSMALRLVALIMVTVRRPAVGR